mmetsp:Transcript_12855/g.32470  ORF Transcript_12855/g.32470 Transcript_12855/m.32470 type:complete len:219 (+) Transcript_12855:470-1126(+)
MPTSIVRKAPKTTNGSRITFGVIGGRLVVWFDQVLLAGLFLFVVDEGLNLQCPGKRNFSGIITRKRCANLIGHFLTQFSIFFSTDLLKERCQQPATETPRHAVASAQDRWSSIKATIDIDLLMLVRAIATVFGRGLNGRTLHRCQDIVGKISATRCIKGHISPCCRNRICELRVKVVITRIAHMLCANLFQDIDLLLLAHNIDQGHTFVETDLLQHLT